MAPTKGIPCGDIKKAGMIVGLVEIVLCILALYGLASNLARFGSPYFLWFLVGVISIVIISIAIILLFYAIRSDKARFLLPHLSAQIFLILFLFIVALVVALLLIFGAYRGIRNLLGVSKHYMSDESTLYTGILIIVVYTFVALLEIFFVYIVWNLYKCCFSLCWNVQDCRHLKAYELSVKQDPFGDDTQPVYWQSSKQEGALPPEGHGSPASGDVYPYGQH